MNKVLVTGANGFIGPHLVNLLRNDHKVRVLVRTRHKADALPQGIEVFIADITKPYSLKNCCAGIDTVFHLAGYAHAWADDDAAFVERQLQVNLHGTENMLKEAVRTGVKQFIYFSSVKADSDTPYGIAKRQAEELVMETGAQHDMHVVVLRLSLVYGPNCKGNLATMLRAIDKGRFLPLPKVQNSRSMVSIEDVCQAALLAAVKPLANGKIYQVTDGKAYSTHELYVSMCEALGKSVPPWRMPLFAFRALAAAGDAAGIILRRRMPFNSDALDKLFGSAQYDSRQIEHDLGFKARYDLHMLLPQIVSAYRGSE